MLPLEKKKLIQISKLDSNQIAKNLKEILKIIPRQINIQDMNEDGAVISGSSVLNAEERTVMLEQRISALNEKLENQRKVLHGTNSNEKESEDASKTTSVGQKRKSQQPPRTRKKVKVIDMPDPAFLVGKRVEHEFLTKPLGGKRRQRTIFPGIVLNIVKESKDPLYTLYRIRYDVDDMASLDDSDDEEVQTDFVYELMADYIKGGLKIVDG